MEPNSLTEMLAEFQEQWEGNTIDLTEVVMMMDAAKRSYKCYFGEDPTNDQVIQLSRVIAKNRLLTAMAS